MKCQPNETAEEWLVRLKKIDPASLPEGRDVDHLAYINMARGKIYLQRNKPKDGAN